MNAQATSRRRNIVKPGINLTPLLDAVFILIFFFLVSTTMRRNEAQTEIKLPESKDSAAPLNTEDLSITINADTVIYFRGEEITEEELEVELGMLKSWEARRVRIRADKTVDWENVHKLMLICKRAGIKNVSFPFRRNGI